MKYKLLALAVLLLWTAGPLQAAVQLRGQVRNGSHDSLAVANIEVKLLAFKGHSDQMAFTRATVANTRGEFLFKDLPLDSRTIFYASADYDGISYYSTPIHAHEFSNNESERPVFIYEKTTATSALDIPMYHIFFEAEGKLGYVREVMVVQNNGNKAIVISAADSGMAPAVVRIGLPLGAEQVQLVSGMDPATTQLVNRALLIRDTILPGTHQYSFVYQIPVRGNQFDLSRSMYVQVSVLSLFTPQNIGTIASQQLHSSGPFTIRNVVYNRYASEPIEAGTSLEIRIAGTGSGRNFTPFVIVGIALVVFIGVLVAVSKKSLRPIPGKEAKKKNDPLVKALAAERSALIAAIAELDDQFEAGTISSEHYQEQRQAQLGRLMRVDSRKSLLES